MLARVGSYYHDIGKLSKPEYFIENTNSALYRHENLSPTMSTLIIIAHVKDGLEMAQDMGLPPAVLDIIAQHHGTTVVEYFYKKHLGEEQREGAVLDDTSFRYPCPKPQTSEAAVVMLADAAESASRTLSEPTPGSIESLVNQIIQNRLNDGQLSECSITLDELHRIERALVKGLNSIYHGRVRY
jgi:cyclic-di-AMP phosphodiesterase PgpH